MRAKRRLPRTIVVWVLSLIAGFYALCAVGIGLLRWIDPWTTMVQIERRIQALRTHHPYRKQFDFVPLADISLNLQHAVVAAEDGRFRRHHGFDWVEMQKVLEDDVERHRMGRGGWTITQ